MSARPLFACLAMLAVGAPSVAAPIINTVFFSTERREANSIPGWTTLPSQQERTTWGLNVTTSGSCAGVSAVVSRPGNTSFNLVLDTSPIFSNCDLGRLSIPFGSTAAMLAFASQTNPWSYTVTDSTGTVTGFFPLIAEAEALPFVQNIAVSDSSATPTVSWDLPDLTGFDVDRVELRAIDAASTQQIFRVNLAANATSFQLPTGALLLDHSYYYRVVLTDLENGGLENRSYAFSDAAVRVPEPGSLALFGAALALLAGLGKPGRRADCAGANNLR